MHDVKKSFRDSFRRVSTWSKKLIHAHLRLFGFQLADPTFKKSVFKRFRIHFRKFMLQLSGRIQVCKVKFHVVEFRIANTKGIEIALWFSVCLRCKRSKIQIPTDSYNKASQGFPSYFACYCIMSVQLKHTFVWNLSSRLRNKLHWLRKQQDDIENYKYVIRLIGSNDNFLNQFHNILKVMWKLTNLTLIKHVPLRTCRLHKGHLLPHPRV